LVGLEPFPMEVLAESYVSNELVKCGGSVVADVVVGVEGNSIWSMKNASEGEPRSRTGSPT